MAQIPDGLGLTAEQVEELLLADGRAPSLPQQPTRAFPHHPPTIELHSDWERALPVADPDGRVQRMVCGAALFNLRLRMHARMPVAASRDAADLLLPHVIST